MRLVALFKDAEKPPDVRFSPAASASASVDLGPGRVNFAGSGTTASSTTADICPRKQGRDVKMGMLITLAPDAIKALDHLLHGGRAVSGPGGFIVEAAHKHGAVGGCVPFSQVRSG